MALHHSDPYATRRRTLKREHCRNLSKRRFVADTLSSGVAHRYATALFDLAKEEGALDTVEVHVDDLLVMLDESEDFRRLMASPVFSSDEQTAALSAVMARAGIDGLAANFMKLTAQNRRLFAAPAMLRAFKKIAQAERGEIIASVTSAEPLSDQQIDALKTVLSEKAAGTVTLETHVDPSLIGGLIVQLGSQMIDTSVKTRLQALSSAMKEAA